MTEQEVTDWMRQKRREMLREGGSHAEYIMVSPQMKAALLERRRQQNEVLGSDIGCDDPLTFRRVPVISFEEVR